MIAEILPTWPELIERLEGPQLDGSIGTNREHSHLCQILAKNDLEAILCWLNEYKHRNTTYRSYQKEAERLLLWCVYQRKKPFSSLTRDDLELYFEFLSDPKPQQRWCAPRGQRENRRGSPGWRPFVGPLNLSAKNTAISIIHSLFNYLIDARYLLHNPFSLMRNRKKRLMGEENKIQVMQRILEPEEWKAMLDTLDNWPDQTPHEKDEKERLRFLVAILYLLGLRINELATHTWSAFRNVQGKWWFFVIGKGAKPGKIPVNQSLLEAIVHYRRHFKKKTAYPSPHEADPIIQSWRSSNGLSARQMHSLLKQLALETTKRFADSPEKIAKFKKFSPHWLRHLSASMQDRAGVAFKNIKANHRHESDETTRLYVHALDDERHLDMEKLAWHTQDQASRVWGSHKA